MLDTKSHTIWRSLISLVLIIAMISSLGGAAVLSYGEGISSQYDIDADPYDDPYDGDDDDDPYDNGSNDDDDPYNSNNDDDDDPYDNDSSNDDDDDDPYDDGNDDDGPRVTFEFNENPVEIRNIEAIEDPTAFLLYGVKAFDENGEDVEVEILCHGDSILGDESFDLENLLPDTYFTVEYKAIHPETDEIFTAYRKFYVMPLGIMPFNTMIDTDWLIDIIVGDGETVILNNGASVTGAVIVNPGGTLIMNGGEIISTGTTPAVLVAGGTFTMNSGYIRLATNNNARGVRITNSGIFTMGGGAIRNIAEDVVPEYNFPLPQGNGNNRGFGVEIISGEFTMNGGMIRNTSTAVSLSGANSAAATFNMRGGSIEGNATSETRSPGVNVSAGTFTMVAGAIRENIHTWALNTNDGGVGVRLNGAQAIFVMGDEWGGSGDIHSNYHLGGIGGGVHVRGGASFTMNSGTIRNNTAGRNSIGTGESGGGGVAVLGAASRFTMNGGFIVENRTRTSGGGVSVRDAQFTMTNGTISDNEATNTRTGRGIGGAGYYSGGGGVWVYGSGAVFTMSGGTISHNRTGGFWNSWRTPGATATHRDSVPVLTERDNYGRPTGYRPSADWMAAIADTSTGTGGQNQNGGGVFALRNATFNMSGGTISHNVAGDFLRFWGGNWTALPRGGTYHGGGGIATRNHATVNITAGTISHNRSPSGGGIYVDNWSQVRIGGAGSNVFIEYNIAYGRRFTNLLGWDGRGGGGIATGDGLYYGNRHTANPINMDPPPRYFDENRGVGIALAQRHTNTALCILDGTRIRYNISGGDGGGIYWWASSAVAMNDERYLHGLRVERGAYVQYNIAYAGANPIFNPLTPTDGRLWQVSGRIDDSLNDRHNINPRRRVATTVVRNGRVNPGGMWLDDDMAAETRQTRTEGSGAARHFAGPGHHAFNNHDIRTVGGVSWTRPELDEYDPEPPTPPPPPMQEISQGRVQLEIVGPEGAPAKGSDTPFPNVNMGGIEVGLYFTRDDDNADLLPTSLPYFEYANDVQLAQRTTYHQIRNELGGFPRATLPTSIIINQNTGNEQNDPIRSAARQVYSILPQALDNGSIPAYNLARTHHGTNVELRITDSNTANPTHRVTKVEVFGACGCRVLDHSWVNVVNPPHWTAGGTIPSGWAPGPYLLNHFCLTHADVGQGGVDRSNPNLRAGGTLPESVSRSLQPNRNRPHVNENTDNWPSAGDLFYHEGCQACRDEHPTALVSGTPLNSLTFNHMLSFLEEGRPYHFRPGPGFGAYGLIFRVTIEPIIPPEAGDELRLGVISDSIDFGIHNIIDAITGDAPIRLGGIRYVPTYDIDGNPILNNGNPVTERVGGFRYVQAHDLDGNPIYDLDNNPVINRVRNGSNPAEIGFTVHDSRDNALRNEQGWRVYVEADEGSVFSSMLRLNYGTGTDGRGNGISGAKALLLNHTDAPNCILCNESPAYCTCPTRLTRVTWNDLMRNDRDIVVCINVNASRIPPIPSAERHRTVLTWTVMSGDTPGEGNSWTSEYNSTPPTDNYILTMFANEDNLFTLVTTNADTPRRRRGLKPNN